MENWEEAINYFEKAGAKLVTPENADDQELIQRNFFRLGYAEYNLDKFSFAKASFQRANSYGVPKDKIAEMIAKCEFKLSASSNNYSDDNEGSTAAES